MNFPFLFQVIFFSTEKDSHRKIVLKKRDVFKYSNFDKHGLEISRAYRFEVSEKINFKKMNE